MCKKPTYDASQKGSKRHNWVIFFWLVEIYIYSSYPKIPSVARLWRGQRLVRLETIRNIVFESVTNLWVISDSSETHIRSIYNPSHDSSETYM